MDKVESLTLKMDTLTGQSDAEGTEGNKGILQAYNDGLNKIIKEIRTLFKELANMNNIST